MPKCEPVQCDITDYTGQSRTVDSYGRRRKRDLGLISRVKRRAEMEEALVVSTLHIVDRLAARQDTLVMAFTRLEHLTCVPTYLRI